MSNVMDLPRKIARTLQAKRRKGESIHLAKPFDPAAARRKIERAQEKLKTAYEERNNVRRAYYYMKDELRKIRDSMDSNEYYDQLNTLKRSYAETCDRVFNVVRSCKSTIEKQEKALLEHTS